MKQRGKSSRRKFLSASIGGAAAGLGGACGAAPEAKPRQPRLTRLHDDPHAPVNLPGRDEFRRPPDWGPAVRTNWDAKNVIVIMLDSFRADHLGAFGNSKVPTPHLDRFAGEATFFTRSYPEGLPTIPVRTSLFTGKFTYPFRPWQVLHPQDQPLLAEILWSEGFRSALISDTYHMHKPAYGFGRGFDEVVWIRGQESDPFVRDPGVQVDVEPYFKPRTGNPREAEQTRQYLLNRHDWQSDGDHFTPRVMDEALRWLKRQKKPENLFLWIDSFCPHEPWDPPESYLKRAAPQFAGKKLILPDPGDVEGYLTAGEMDNIRGLYAGVIAFVDECVGRFLDEVRRLGMFENTLIVVATDHGEPFGDHGIVRKARPWAYEELAHTFLMIREPSGGGVARVESYTQQTDITATILEFLSIPPPDWMTSRSLLPLIVGREEKVREFSVCCHYDASLNLRQDDWSYHYFLEGRGTKREGSKLVKDGPELYNLRDDPTEHNNLIAQEPDRAREMDRRLREFTEELIRHEERLLG
jgi:arylsulfatase A-like enzyme